VNAEFADWLANDFLPTWRETYAITDDPARTIVTGMSLGGLMSAYCALRHPGAFGNVLSQSGSFWWRPEGENWQWLTDQFEASPQLPIRWYLDVGLLEDTRREESGRPSMLDASRRLRDVLASKGYDVCYAEFNGGHDYVSWRGTIADGLAYLLPR
jgi:enterochelin esterase family protein